MPSSAGVTHFDGGDGLLSLREAFTKANADAGEDTIQLAASATYELTICGGSEGYQDTDNAVGDLDATDQAGLVLTGAHATVRQTCAEHLNYRPPNNAPNQVMVRVGLDDSVSMLNGDGTVEIILDANGYFVAD